MMVVTHEMGFARKVADRVVFAGRLPDDAVAALYASCELFALPTGMDAKGQVEGFGLVFLEAMALGIPVISIITLEDLLAYLQAEHPAR